MNQEIMNQIEKMIADTKEGKNNIDATDIVKLIESENKKSLEERLQDYLKSKRDAEIKESTINDIESKIRHFFNWGNINTYEEITKEKYKAYKQYLLEEKDGRKKRGDNNKKQDQEEQNKGEKITTINKRITFINGFLKYIKLDGYCLKQERIQNKSNLENVYTRNDLERLIKFCNSNREIEKAKDMQVQAKTKEEIKNANMQMRKAKMIQKKKKQAKAIIITFFALGIRDAEVEFVTVEAIKRGKIEITNKGKTREIPVQKDLKKELLQFCKEKEIKTGCIFQSQNKSSKRLSHTQIWRILQWATGQMRINKDKAHEHSIRHLTGKEIAKASNNDRKVIADILGHSDSRTSEIYLQKSFAEQKADMEKLGIKELSKIKG